MIYQRESIQDSFYNFGNEVAEVVTKLPKKNETIQIDVFNPQAKITIDEIYKIECACRHEKSREYNFYYVLFCENGKYKSCVLAIKKEYDNEQ